jgi:Caspase domain
VGPKIQGAVKAKMTKAQKKRLKQQKKAEKKKKKGGGGPAQLSYAAQQNISAADVILFSGCADDQTSADATIRGTATGAMTNAFVATLTRVRCWIALSARVVVLQEEVEVVVVCVVEVIPGGCSVLVFVFIAFLHQRHSPPLHCCVRCRLTFGSG